VTPEDRLAEVIRVEGARLQATLVRTLGDWSLAEEAVQEATIAALQDWAAHGLPDHPRAWLTATARRKAIDVIRRERIRGAKEQAGAELMELTRPDEPVDTVLDDDVLRLIFTCCHPSLAPDARLALALRTLCQLSVPQVAAAMLTSEAAMAKRLTRIRQKISIARIGYRVPADSELPARLSTVCGVVHALYTTGHAPLGGDSLLDVDLCTEGLRLARELHRLLPDEAMPAAVLALILLTEARRPARVDEHGDPVLLADQDRSCWDLAMIAEGTTLLEQSLRRTGGVADPYQLQAAIAYEHDRASAYADTDWAEIVRLYDLLLSVAPSAPAVLGRAVALAERDGPEAGLAALADLPADQRREAVRSELLGRLGRYAEAAEAVSAALVEEAPAGQQRYWERRRAEWQATAGPPPSPRAGPGRPPDPPRAAGGRTPSR
jgi:RNA polymerase sigma-70 factor, ECF subfamily